MSTNAETPKPKAKKVSKEVAAAPVAESPKPRKASGGGASIVGHDATVERKKAEVAALRNRIAGHGDVSPGLIHAHNMNFRKHGASQVSALAGSMDDLGWIKTILVSKHTNTIIDGHARWEEAVRRKLPSIPVTWLDLTKDEENKALALLDPITEMATRDDAIFAKLLESVSSDNAKVDETVAKMLKAATLKDEEFTGGKVETSTQILEYTTDVFFPSTSKWGIPDLREDMLYDGDCPTTTWPLEEDEGHPQFYVYGEGGFDERVTGRILTFYTDDFRFERIWSESVEAIRRIVPLKPLAACQPDFSLWGTDPLAVQMYNLYRARWISRYWQEAGIKCIPSIARSLFTECYEFILHGLPKVIPVAAIQIRSDGCKTKQHVEATVRDIQLYLDYAKIDKIIIYGVSARSILEQRLPKGPEYIWCVPFADAWFTEGQKIKAAKKAANMLKLAAQGAK